MGFVFTTEPAAAHRHRVARGGAADWVALQSRAALAIWTLVTSAFLDSINVVASLLQIELLTRIQNDGEFSESQVVLNDSAMEFLGWLQMITLLLTVVFFCRWMLQAVRNVLAFKPWRMSYTPGQAVASFFIPFLNLVRPYKAMKQLYKASTEPGSSISIVRVWWGFYLVSAILGNLAARASWRADESSEWIVATWLSIVASAVAVPAAFLAAHLVRRVSAGLRETHGMVSHQS
jgi:glucan phosphoethanolaminetransferase (alkaline phosphatase superfamily)